MQQNEKRPFPVLVIVETADGRTVYGARILDCDRPPDELTYDEMKDALMGGSELEPKGQRPQTYERFDEADRALAQLIAEAGERLSDASITRIVANSAERSVRLHMPL